MLLVRFSWLTKLSAQQNTILKYIIYLNKQQAFYKHYQPNIKERSVFLECITISDSFTNS